MSALIPAQQVVELALAAAATSRRSDETIVIVTEIADASLRWAGNSMTTNGVSISRSTSVISINERSTSVHILCVIMIVHLNVRMTVMLLLLLLLLIPISSKRDRIEKIIVCVKTQT